MPEFFDLVSPDEARALILEHVHPLGDTESVSTADAVGRVVAADVTSPHALPEFHRSTVDGYAVVARDTFGASESLPAYLTLVGEVPMGQPATVTVAPSQAAIVHTGGMIPPGADAVVMIEHTHLTGQDEIEVRRPAAPGENVIEVGEDIAPGDPIMSAGHRLRAQDVGGLLAVGITALTVARRPRVAIFATGDEVIPPDQPTQIGQVRDINSYTVAALVEEAGGLAIRGGILPDDHDALLARARQALEEEAADMLVLSAGSSVSVRDMTAEVFDQLGEPGVLVHGVATRPGKPTILAVAAGKPLMGLPGNPVSALVQSMMVGVPVVHRLQGAPPPRRLTTRARLTTNVASAAGREDYLPARLVERDGELWADPIFYKSNLIFTLVEADGLLKIPLDATGLEAGAWVEVRVF
jgi:molybdopterin molybdotransferase